MSMMMSPSDLFYGEREPVWIVDTSASPLVRVSTSFLKNDSDYYGGYNKRQSGHYGNPPRRHAGYSHDADFYDTPGMNRYSEYSSRPVSRYADAYYDNSDTYYTPSTYGSVYPNEEYRGSTDYYHDSRPYSRTVLKVPICCETCCEEVRTALREIRGVRSIQCDVNHERIVVTGTAPPADVLKACKKLHKKSRFWSVDD